MNNKNLSLIIPVVIIILILIGNPFYIVEEGKQAIITQFGQPIGDPITSAGLHLKAPFIQKITFFEKRILEWDGFPSEIPTKDKRYIWIDTTARWQIVDALKFFKSVANERGAHAILDGIIDAAVRDAVTAQDSFEVVRSTNRLRELIEKQKAEQEDEFIDEGALATIKMGREKIREEIVKKAKSDLGPRYGIELIDVRIKRVNYIEKVRQNVYERMIAERKRAAEQYRSEGRGIRAEVEGKTEKELKEILSKAYKHSQEIKGNADAEATKIYADAYSRDSKFFSFLKTLETYSTTVDKNTTIILTTEGEYFKYLTNISP
ncbi:MAG: protease modulator HflC [Candidatus Omnitrophica bacterium]|nr:protease modulator HflC [Candidatus Omnitrophota bacterium]